MTYDVELDSVSLTYYDLNGATPAIRDLSLRVASGEFVSLVGPSGCGKSSLLSVISGLVKPDAGSVCVLGQSVTRPTTDVGYMLQNDHLFEWRTILENCLLGLEVRGRRTKSQVEHVRQLLKKYGLAGFEHHRPSQLSGGMRQRAALVRTLALDPRVLLLDEPFSALDYQTRLRLEEEMCTVLRQAGKTVIYVTHDIASAVSMSDRVLVLSHRPATVKKEVRIFWPHDRSPIAARETPEFSRYFREIWREIDVDRI